MSSWKFRKKATKWEILSLIGVLQHATRIVQPGRAFLSRMYATAAKLRKLHFYTRSIGVPIRAMLVGHFPRQLEWQKFAPVHNHTENGCNWSGPFNGPQYTSCPRNYYPLFSAVRSRAHYWLDKKYHSSVITAVW